MKEEASDGLGHRDAIILAAFVGVFAGNVLLAPAALLLLVGELA